MTAKLLVDKACRYVLELSRLQNSIGSSYCVVVMLYQELTSIKLITNACKNERKTVSRLVSACNKRHKFPALRRQ